MCAFTKAWKVNASLPDVTFWARPEQGGLGTQKARAIITSETISLPNQCMCLNDDLRQVTIQDMSQAIAHLGCSTIAEAQAELQWSGEDWKQHPSLCHRFLACTSRGMQIEWTAIQFGFNLEPIWIQLDSIWTEIHPNWILSAFSKCQHTHPHRRTHEFDASLQTHCIQ